MCQLMKLLWVSFWVKKLKLWSRDTLCFGDILGHAWSIGKQRKWDKLTTLTQEVPSTQYKCTLTTRLYQPSSPPPKFCWLPPTPICPTDKGICSFPHVKYNCILSPIFLLLMKYLSISEKNKQMICPGVMLALIPT